MAKFYGIGTGPGDSSLLTIKAVETLQNLDTLYTPEAKKGGESLALSIVSKYIPDKFKTEEMCEEAFNANPKNYKFIPAIYRKMYMQEFIEKK